VTGILGDRQQPVGWSLDKKPRTAAVNIVSCLK